ncbi:hypothetical protein VTL71DRAFT_4735 [Oculimacula yallundae]|uniref:Uncharacterized protein n=1 Tax=Oculimacula yallundae TaxID=86028 RepID=A0ABR4C2T2_9HELO
MALSSKTLYTPKNTTHKMLLALLTITTLIGLLIAIFRPQIHTSLTSICDSISLSSPSSPDSILTSFQPNLTYQSLSPSTDKLWNSLVTPNGGFILEKARDDEEGKVYGVGMFHQLHCLQIFRDHFQELYSKLGIAGTGTGTAKGTGMKRSVVHGHHLDLGHTLHCMDYFRQVFLCFADGSLEASEAGPNGELPTINGMVPHQCRDPASLYERSLASPASGIHMKSKSEGPGR